MGQDAVGQQVGNGHKNPCNGSICGAVYMGHDGGGREREREERVTRIRNWFISYVSATPPSLLPTPLEWHNARFNWIDSLRYAEQAVPERVKEREDRKRSKRAPSEFSVYSKQNYEYCLFLHKMKKFLSKGQKEMLVSL